MNIALRFLVTHWRRLPLEEFRVPSRLSCIMATPRFRASSHVILFVFADGESDPILVMKVPRLPGDNARLDLEAANLRKLHATRFGGFHSIPRVVACEDYYNNRLLLETALQGQTMSPALVRRQPKVCIEVVLAWLVNLHLATGIRNGDDRRWFEQSALRPLERFGSAFRISPEERHLIEQTRNLITPLQDQDLPLVFEHGDLSSPNILIQENGCPGVVDWELAEPRGLPAVDLFFFLTYIAFARRRARKPEDYMTAFHEAFFGPEAWARSFVIRYAEALKLPTEALNPLFVLCWSRYVSSILMRLNDPNPRSTILKDPTAAWLRSNRYYALWRYTVKHVKELNLAS